MSLDEPSFVRLADETLKYLLATIEDALADDLDIDLEGGILTIRLEAGGIYVINKQAPNRQIWLASPASGAWHFDYREGPGKAARWIATKGGGRLSDLLSRELSAATETPLALD
ncbi:MAG: iron donor protein CyaY [Alphaproteobacteria bacterium]|nr:iron donor protein CyaY [Alphaproteobacteria bacterium]